MTIGPILPGRIPNALVSTRLLTNLRQTQLSLTTLQDQVATGQRIFLPSDAPSAASRTQQLQLLLERKSQAQTNVQVDQSLLGASDAALANVSDALNTAKSLILAGTGSAIGPTEKQALATEATGLLKQVLETANTKFRDRYLFGGARSSQPPYSLQADGTVLYHGDRSSIQSYIDVNATLANNVSGDAALVSFSKPVTSNLNPALTTATRLSDLHGGQGLTLGSIVVTVEDAGVPVTIEQTVDLAGAETIADVQNRIQAAFAAQPVTVTVGLNPANNGLAITTSSGTATVAVTDVAGGLTAADLGIASGAAASITGSDLDPRLTLQTRLADLNGGAGITATAGGGLRITNGLKTADVDVSTAVTVEDLFNLLKQANVDLDTQINAAGNGLAITSRLSGANLSIGENGETTAADLGIRTFSATTRLADLDFGRGVPADPTRPLRITRRDGTQVDVDLTGAANVQDVLDAINAVDPGNLVAAVATVGNGLTLTDNSGTGPLTIDANDVSHALGIAGTETGNDPLVPLTGTDPNPQEVKGTFNLLVRLQTALNAGDNRELERLDRLLDQEINRVNQTRGEIGGRLRVLEQTANRLAEDSLRIQESLSRDFDTDITAALTELVNRQFTLEATMQVAAQSMRLSLISFL